MRNFILPHKTRKYSWAVMWVLLAVLVACGKDLEKETFDVYLITGGKEEKVGTVVGISQCRIKAENIALYSNYIEYDYTCCLKTAENPCAEKHK